MKEHYNDKKFDHIVRSKVEGFQMDGTDELWDKISGDFSKIDEEKKKKRRFGLMLFSTVGLALFLGFVIFYYEGKVAALSALFEVQSAAKVNENKGINFERKVNISNDYLSTTKKDYSIENMNQENVRTNASRSFFEKQNSSVNRVKKSIAALRFEEDNKLTKNTTKTLMENRIEEAIKTAEFRDSIPTKMLEEEIAEQANPEETIKTDQEKPTVLPEVKDDYKSISKGLSLEVYGSPRYSWRKLKPNPEGGLGFTVGEFNAAERGKVTFSFGTRIQKEISSKLSLYSGIEFSQYRQMYSSVSTPARIDTISRVYTLNTSLGSINFSELDVEKPGEIQANGENATLSFRSLQKLSFITIPFGLQNEIYSFKKHKFVIGADFSANFILGGSTRLSLSDGEGGSDSGSGEHGGFKIKGFDGLKQMTFGYGVNFGYEYSLSSRLSISMRPSLRGSVTSVNETNGVKLFPYSIGLESGIKLRLK